MESASTANTVKPIRLILVNLLMFVYVYAVSEYTDCSLFYHTQVLLVLPGRFGCLQDCRACCQEFFSGTTTNTAS